MNPLHIQNHTDNNSFIQTVPSRFTGNSLGFIQWHGHRGDYVTTESEVFDLTVTKPEKDYLKNIKHLDHAATRLRARARDAAIIEFMELTNYNFDFAIYAKVFNSITNVARLSKSDFAMVFSTGISDYINEAKSGPTEKFVHNYGPRVHHLAYHTEHIDETYAALSEDGMDFLIELVGSPEEGLKQTFSVASEQAHLAGQRIYPPLWRFRWVLHKK